MTIARIANVFQTASATKPKRIATGMIVRSTPNPKREAILPVMKSCAKMVRLCTIQSIRANTLVRVCVSENVVATRRNCSK